MNSLRDLMGGTTTTDVPKLFRVTRSPRFNRHFRKFVEGAQKMIHDYYLVSVLTVDTLSVQKCRGRDLVRIVCTFKLGSTSSKLAWCFVDLTNGDVLKVGSWTEPGKPIGNIFDGSNGLGGVSVFHPMSPKAGS
jgi:hypothetical protein